MTQDGVKKTSTMVAIYPPEDFLALADKHAHADLIASGLHVTLYYVGDTTEDDDNALIQALQRALSAIKTPLTMRCAGPAAFYDRENHRVIRNLTMNAVGLDILRYKVLREMWREGFVGYQTHGFSAHLTLQYHEDTNLFEGWERCGLEPYPEFKVDRVYLVRQNEVIAQVMFGGETRLGGSNPARERLK